MNLEGFLLDNELWYRIILKNETIHTTDAAMASGIQLHRITKNLVSVTNEGEYFLLIVPGDRRVDLNQVAKILKVREINLVPFKRAEEISGYPPGGTPSIGHKFKMRVVIDESILEFGTIFCGGGSRDKLIELRTDDVLRLTNAIIANITQ